MSWKGALGLMFCAVALALVGWILFFSHLQIKVDLPPAAPSRDPGKKVPVVVEILADGSIRVDGAPSTLDNLPRDIAAKASSPPGTQQIMIRASQNVNYAAYTAVLERCRVAGWTKVGVIASGDGAP